MTYKGTSFSKMSGTGNDFIVIDNMALRYDYDWSDFAKNFCQRRTSIGADGVLILEPHRDCAFNYRIFNADGSEASMCGNGARCAAQFAYDNAIAPREMTFMTLAGLIEAKVNADDVAVKMTLPKNLRTGIRLDLNGQIVNVHHIDTGVPHTILFTEMIDSLDVDNLGRTLRRHQEFSPAGTNVDFVQVSGPDSITVRTYERGVEAETLACGTGAVAAAIIADATGMVESAPVNVRMPGGRLKIDFTKSGNSYTDVWLIGKVTTIYQAQIY